MSYLKTRQKADDGFTYHHEYPDFQINALSNLQRITLPRTLHLLAWLLVAGFLLTISAFIYVPWVQTTSGMGVVTTLDPRDRVQNISALISGRIAEWYVRDGDTVKVGDPLVRIQDVDDEYVSRLQAQLDAARRKFTATKSAADTAVLDANRREELFAQGLTSRLEVEQARIKVQQMRVSEEDALGELNQAEVILSRQGSQMVFAPRNGVILHVEAGDIATIISAGQTLASFMPSNTKRAVEIFIDGRDIGLVQIGSRARLEFETWPAFQFSGLPEFAVGTFAGEVVFVEPGSSVSGKFRVLVAEPAPDPDCISGRVIRPGLNIAGNCGWPPENFVRLGANTRGWILLDKVPLGYELWRLLNNFPPGNRLPAGNASNGQEK